MPVILGIVKVCNYVSDCLTCSPRKSVQKISKIIFINHLNTSFYISSYIPDIYYTLIHFFKVSCAHLKLTLK